MHRQFAAALALVGVLGAPAVAQIAPDDVVEGDTPFEMRVLTTGLSGPWELTWGPDGYLWVTERVGGRITRVNPEDGSKSTAIAIDEVRAPGGQDGLLGLALHPELLQGTGNDYVYTAYSYVDESLGADETVTNPNSDYRFLYTKIVRLTYNEATETLGDPMVLIAGMPASNDHNSGRMKIGPDMKLYYTIGDGGNNQLGNWCIPIESQRLPTADEMAANDLFAYQGKSLRLNLDGSIPEDNPELDGVTSHVFTYGHRNMQGIAFAPDGTLYGSEHGPKSDDEVNILVPGGNYGWPHVSGFKDNNAYQFARWSDATVPCEELSFSDLRIHPSVPVEDETSWPGEMQDPLAGLFTVPSDFSFSDPACGGIDFICWPTVAPSSIEVYSPETGGIPGWENSLLLPTLKRGSIYVLPLNDDGTSLRGPIQRHFQSENRFRDTAVGPDNLTVYVATDNGGVAEDLSGGVTTTMANPGSILVFTYAGDAENVATTPVQDGSGDATTAGSEVGVAVPAQFTAEQARRGKLAYEAGCVSCHGQNLIAAHYGPPLAGPYFDGRWIGESVAALYAHTHDRMPPSRPGELPDETYADLVAYILEVNGLTAGETPLPTDMTRLTAMSIIRDE